MRPTDPAAVELITHGTIDVEGRLVDASNATLFGGISLDGLEAKCVYKPINGERPLWDFPDGTLAGREVASYLISEASGAGLIPPTVHREGPFGAGMVQLWVDTKEGDDLVDVTAPSDVPPGWKAVLHAMDRFGEPAVLAHSDNPGVALMAALDVVLNNADRKGGHVLHATDGGVYGVDHGICLHTENKLRTVLWGWMGEALPAEAVDMLRALLDALAGDLGEQLHEHLTRREVRALVERTENLLRDNAFPEPSSEWRAIPWPAF
ncbi:putative repeat protein (TIGR03843 family) [Herbihabitans rhizosphaerae]|uniref:Putative repeat protein (TIGR03843 family) n=1 Tax=Herbihabitans rhizosphaerae TaxID=1872711 RepID=A0A4Q7L2C0_9PSEU|nr:putative repeat protein (TIGR03843 family) [Herbihabitans rhizosphaerae]